MERGQTSHDLLAHFDRPKTIDLPDFEWVDEVIPPESRAIRIDRNHSLGPFAGGFIELPQITRRGVRWVMTWALAFVVLAFAASTLIEFVYVLTVEHTLRVAARAGAMEATLPRATCQSVTATVERRLRHYPLMNKQLHLSLTQNGSLVQTQFRQNSGDRFAVTLWAPHSAAMPDWLRIVMFWRGDSRIQAHAEQQMPGRKIAFGADIPAHPAAE
jgi:hypothetical protein